MCGDSLGVPPFLIYLFSGRFTVVEVKKKFTRGCLLFLSDVLQVVGFFVLTKEWRFPTVIEGSLLRIGVALQTLLSVF